MAAVVGLTACAEEAAHDPQAQADATGQLSSVPRPGALEASSTTGAKDSAREASSDTGAKDGAHEASPAKGAESTSPAGSPRTKALGPVAQPSQADAPAGLADTAPSPAELSAWAAQLRDPEEGVRRAAFEQLTTLSEDALPSIGKRLSWLAKQDWDKKGVLDAMTEFRRVQGVEAPEADVDLALGVLPTLARSREEPVATAAELVALLRALEAQQSHAAGEVIVARLFALDDKLFRYEAPRTRERMGALLVPAMIRHQSHPKAWVRSFCQDGLRALGMDSPGRAVQQNDVTLLAAILEAYGDTLTFDAMPVVTSYVTDERHEVRNAARRAVQRFGRNAIWQIRERYLNATGKEADPSWTYQRVLHALYEVYDAPKREAFKAALAKAKAAFERGDDAAAVRALDEALQAEPRPEQAPEAATLYAQLGERALAQGHLQEALQRYRRARRLHPESSEAPQREARIRYLEAASRLGAGVADLGSFRSAQALDRTFTPAADAVDELSGARAARDAERRRMFGLGAAVLMALGGFFLMRQGQQAKAPPSKGEEPEPAAPSEEQA